MAGIVALGAIVALLALLAATTPASAASPSAEPDRYDFANDCYVVHALGADRYIARSGDGYAATATSAGEAQPFFMSRPSSGATSSTARPATSSPPTAPATRP